MIPPKLEVADVLNANWEGLKQSGKLNSWQYRTLYALKRCRTAELGTHIDGCTSCGHVQMSYNSCRNRHCPKCQGNLREQWIQDREKELLPVPYFHVVFTLPDNLNGIYLHEPAILSTTLFKVGWSVINDFGHDHKWLGAQTGMIAILHTWGQTLSLHPHLHCIVPGGGLTPQRKWRTAKSQGKYLFPVKAMSKVFRRRFIEEIKRLLPEHMTPKLIGELYKKEWVVYAKRPFTGPTSVIEYLGRYTHKIAISNHRLVSMDDHSVTFNYKDYRHGGVRKMMTLDTFEFIRRFALHILPRGFVRIRHYGIISSSAKLQSAACIKEQLPEEPPAVSIRPKPAPFNPKVCPCCKKETMISVMVYRRRGPPWYWKELAEDILACIK